MTKTEAIQHFGGIRKLAEALGISYEAVRQWRSIPVRRQYELQDITNGSLVVTPKTNDKQKQVA
jgi:molybdenum-dependent DNA-binding transcriptional regulator ModE